MYAVYGKKTSILLWCHLFSKESKKKQPCKRPNEPKDMSSALSSKRNACMQKITEVEEIVSDLQQRHGSEYSVEKLDAWAHMIHMGKHESRQIPPDLPCFGRSKTISDSREKN